jgi:XPB/Ssl2-like helicase family protein
MIRSVRAAKGKRGKPETPPLPRERLPRERNEAFETLARDILTFAGHFERTSTKRVATGGIGKKTVQRIAPLLRRSDEECASFIGIFLIDRRVLFEGEDRWEISRPNLLRLWQPERLLRSIYHFWLRTPLWNESLQDPDVLSLVRREYISQDPALEARRRRLCEELLGTPVGERVTLPALLSRLDRSFQARNRSTDDGGLSRYGGRISPAAVLRRMLCGPLTWLGLVEAAARRGAAAAEEESFRVTDFGRRVLSEDWPAIVSALGTALSNPEARITLQPNLEILVPPDIEPTVYLNLARMGDLRSVDIYTAFAVTWDSLMNALDRGFSAEQVLSFFESVSATGVPATVRQLIQDCEGRHGEVRIGVAGPYIEAREETLLGELEANPRFAPFIQRRIGNQLALLTSNVDLGQLGKELRKAGYSVSSAGNDKLQMTARGAQLSLTRPELEEIYAAVRAATKLAREVDPDFDLSALAALDETLALELTRQEESDAPTRARELESLVDKLLRAKGKRARQAEPPSEARETEDIRALLLTAVEAHAAMEIEYDGFQGVTRRIVEPSSFDGRYLTAFCRLRQDQRVFNTARILSAKLVN